MHIATTFTNSDYRRILSGYGFFLHDLTIDRSGKRLDSLLVNFFRLCKIFRDLKPDLVHLVTIQPVLLGGLAARASGIRRIVFAISGLGHVFVANSRLARLRRLIVEVLYRLSLNIERRAVVFQNPDDKHILTKLCRLSGDESFLLPGSGVDLSSFVFKPLIDEEPLVLMASRLLVTKGAREFVDAAAILRQRGIRARFQLVGDPDHSNPSAISMHELNDWRDAGIVEILGYRNDLHDLMSRSHIICLPSYYPEGLPKVLCEAAACGRVVVTTDEPGCRDAIVNGVTGLLVPSRDSLALADALEYLLSNPDHIRTMGIAGRKRAEQMFDISAIVNQHLGIYSRLLSCL